MIGIYMYKNKINSKIYVGQSVDIERRHKEHSRRGVEASAQQIDQAILKYGLENFDFKVLEECTAEELSNRESHWIQLLDCIAPKGYNLGSVKSFYGENNPYSKLTDNDIIFIRTCYKNRVYKTSAELWRGNYSELSQGTIESVFFGNSWKHLMMEVYTDELKEYYKLNYLQHAIGGRNRNGEDNPTSILKEKEVIEIRRLYQQKVRNDIFKEFSQYSKRVITSIISGQNWKHLPIFKKRDKKWIYPSDWSVEQKQDFESFLKICE